MINFDDVYLKIFYMKKNTILTYIFALSSLVVNAQEKPVNNDWENPAVFEINREAARAAFLPYADESSAIADEYTRSPWFLALDGQWKFNWSPTPDERPKDFLKPILTPPTGKKLQCLPTGN